MFGKTHPGQETKTEMVARMFGKAHPGQESKPEMVSRMFGKAHPGQESKTEMVARMFGKAHPGKLANTDLIARQYIETDDGRLVWFWYTRTGYIVKWSLFLAFIVIFFGWCIGGRMHAKARLRKGLKPMKYHGWLLSRQERAQVDPAYAWPSARIQAAYPPPGPQYGMNGYPAPPPVYDPNRPPVYEGNGGPAPMGATKVDPAQAGPGLEAGVHREDEYAPPAGPPPAR
ncbi:hypothetical protein F4780DRAFT_778905 [Xylariomycetidae sp. FL0641]|nr:hypothetical protein F4780DRAFT_778905 [Xylariomycetidae sp. FL0641]